MSSKSFVPKKYLDDNEKKLLEQTKCRIQQTTNKQDLNYYEIILDLLMKKSINQYKTN